MPSVSSWLLAARLRTLPLSISGILTGAGAAATDKAFSWDIFGLALLATLGFQILSNLANDYGDGVKGTDNEFRVGPPRAMQQGLLTGKDLLVGMLTTALLTFCAVIALIYRAFGTENFLLSVLFLGLGVAAMIAAVKYTVGRSAYGYKGLGDLFVFLFFGIIAVMGTYFLMAKMLSYTVLFPAITIGLLAVAVLHLNNMRDHINDEAVGKRTLAVVLGFNNSKRYQFTLIGIAFLSWFLFLLLIDGPLIYYISGLPFVLLVRHCLLVSRVQHPVDLDPELKKVALTTFLIAGLFFISALLVFSNFGS